MLDTHGWKPTRELAPGEVVGLNGDGRSRLRMLEGRAWITEESRPDDWFVEAGQSLVPGRGARAVAKPESEGRAQPGKPSSCQISSVGSHWFMV